jgi:hypothetical protein
MQKRSSMIILAAAMMTAKAFSQQIVIEPTNGRTQSTTRVTRPAATEAAPAQPKKSALKPVAQERSAPKKLAKKTTAKPVETKAASLEKKPSAVEPEAVKNEPVEATPAPKKALPERPQWAMADTRDAHSLQTEIANALARDPKLAGSSIQVLVDEGTVTLQGHATGPDERLQAQRLAQSYAWNRKLVDRMDVINRVSAQK